MEMQPIEIPEFPKLRGEEAIEALHNFIDELEEQKDKELTDKQTAALIKFAEGLISTIETERLSNTSDKEISFVNQFKKTIMKYIPENGKLWKLTR